MKFTYNWLKDYVDIKLKPKELADKLTMAGLEIELLENLDGDWVFEAEVTTNRPDWLSVIGIAREVAAITGASLRAPKGRSNLLGSEIASVASGTSLPRNDGVKVDIKIEDKRACPRYTGRIISNVKVVPSPQWLQKRLKSAGLRPINNIVDITNFVLLETGQPLHAFDFDKLNGGKIIIRRAKDNEEIVTIDGVKRKLNSGILVIADDKAPVAIAGIMGGKTTEVTEGTKNILLEGAYFDPVITRRASKYLGLSSDSSYRFERCVDLSAVKTASDRATKLILELAKGTAGKFVDIGPLGGAGKKAFPKEKVSLRPQRASGILGIEIHAEKITRILKSLGIKNIGRGTARRAPTRAKLTFIVPSWRHDLKKEIDLIEELARIYGYEKIPAVQPNDIDVIDRIFVPKHLGFQSLVRDTLVSFGLNEALSYSLVDKNIDEIFQPVSAKTNINIKNPLSPQLAVLRRDLIAGVLLSARWNLNRNIADIKLFEIGPVYSSDLIDRQEKSCLAICLSGARVDNWQDGVKPVDFYYLKGIIELLFARLGINGCEITLSENNIFTQGQSAAINISGDAVGFLGKVKKELLNKIDIDKDCFACQIALGKLYSYAHLDKRFSPIPKFPAVYRDISTLAGEEVSSGQIVDVIEEAAAGIVKEIKLFDIYRGGQIPKGHKSLVYRLTYQSPDKTLTDSEVTAVHSRIISSLKEKLAVDTR